MQLMVVHFYRGERCEVLVLEHGAERIKMVLHTHGCVQTWDWQKPVKYPQIWHLLLGK